MLIQRLRQIGRTKRSVQRLRVILGVFIKYGYADVARRLHLLRFFEWPWGRWRRERETLAALPPSERLRRAFEELGPTFIKLGQLLASETHLLPVEFIEQLSLLREDVKTIPYSEIRKVMEQEFKWPLEGIFSSINPEPLAAASVAQVHRAKLRDGTDVVVKVQRPGIREAVETDLEILHYLADLIERHVPEWRSHRPSALVGELGRTLKQELDFNLRASHVERFAQQFAGEKTLFVPRIHRHAMTGRVETMDFVAGVRLAELDEDIPIPVSADELCRRLVDLTMKQVFTHGFFHGDPHPGNLRVLADGRLCYLDYGMMGFLDHRGRAALGDLVYALANQDEVAASHVLLRLAASDHEPSREQLESDLAGFIHRHFGGGNTRLEFNRVLRDLVELMRSHGLHLPGGFLLMLKSLGQAESLVRELNPRHDLIQQATPYVRDLRMERMQPGEIIDGIYEFGREATELCRELPVELRRMLDQLKNGRARLVFRHQGLEPLVEAGDRISNRLSFAVVLAALVIGSSVIVHAGIPPKWHDIPLIGLAGFLMAGVMAFWLLISILRHGRM